MNETQRQRMAQRVGTPAGAVAAVASVRQNDYDLPFLHSLSNVTADPECWQSLREAGIVNLFIDMILLTPKQNSDISVGCYQIFRERLKCRNRAILPACSPVAFPSYWPLQLFGRYTA